MAKKTKIDLTDKQYFDLLKTIRKALDTNKKLDGFDCNEYGSKDMAVSFGLCSKEYTTKENALFPELFPNRKSLKYRKIHHKCPLDTRKVGHDSLNGCFYTCRFFKEKLRDKEIIKKLYDKEIERVEKLQD